MNNNIPKNWEELKLDQLIDFYIGGDWGEEFQIASDYIETRVIRATDISNWEKTNGKNAQIRYLKKSSIEKRELQDGDIVIEISGGSPEQPVGRSIIVRKDKQDNKIYTCSNFFRLLRVNKNKILPEFLNYYFKFLYDTRMIEQYQSNSTNLRNLKFKQFIAQKIPYPSQISEQQEIVQVLDTMSDIIRLRKECIKHAQDLIPALFQEMFGNPKTNKKNWQLCRLKDLAKIDRRNITPEELKNTQYAYIGLEHIEKETGRILIDPNKQQDIDLKSNKFYFTNNHILYGKLRPYLNKVALPNFEGVCSTDIFPLLPVEGLSNKYFIKALMSTSYFVNIANSQSSGANLPRIGTTALENIKVFKPDYTLQEQFAQKAIEIENYIKEQQEELKNAEQMFQSLLHHAFTGELTEHKFRGEANA